MNSAGSSPPRQPSASGLLTASMHDGAVEDGRRAGRRGWRRQDDRRPCKAESPANLDFTLKDMNGATSGSPTTRARSSSSISGRRGAVRARSRSPSFVELYDRVQGPGARRPRRVDRRRRRRRCRPSRREYKMNYPCCLLTTRARARRLRTDLRLCRCRSSSPATARSAGQHLGPATKEQVEREIKALL